MTYNQSPLYIADYNYPLPDERIAKYTLRERDQSKLLVYQPTISCRAHSLYIITRA